MAKDRKEIQAANVDLKLSRIKRLVFPDDYREKSPGDLQKCVMYFHHIMIFFLPYHKSTDFQFPHSTISIGHPAITVKPF